MTITASTRTLALGVAVLLGALVEPPARAQEPSPAPAPAEPPASTVTEPAASTAEPAPDSGPTEYRFELGLVGGGHFFASEHGLGRNEGDPTDKSPDHAGAFGLRLTFNFNRWVAFEGEGLATWTKTRDGITQLWVINYGADVLVNLLPPGPFRPFILAGYGGIASLSADEDDVPSDVDGMIKAGLGAKIALTDNLGLRVEGRVLFPPSILNSVAKVGNETGFGGPDFEALGTLYFSFGEPLSKVVVQKEVVQVPEADPDHDGVVGAADKCPLVAEDKDGFEDEDGCPDNDNDKDGIPDAQDKCPNQPETMNGIDDEDGCPEIDTDGDGILGSRDKCPDQPETVNNYKDDDGCPDEVPAEVKRFTGVIQGINFKTGSDKLLKGSFVILNRAVKVLKDYPDVRLEISGHTDNVGKADYNRDLSQKRADSVKAYLVSQGIASDRLEAVGYGMDKPIASNKTKAGRSKNRRTEFNLMKQAGTPAPAAPGGAPAPGPAPTAPTLPPAEPPKPKP
jgi:OOP family OmpA-OmpF porin